MKIRFQVSFILLGVWLFSAAPLCAGAEPSREPDQVALSGAKANGRQLTSTSRDWMRTMEAAVGPVSPEPEALPTLRAITGWLGWIFALFFLSALVVLQRRVRRQSAFLMRAGERDNFLIRGTGDRRKGERRRHPR